MHGLIIVHVVVTLRELSQMLLIAIRLATVDALQVANVGILDGEGPTLTISLRVRIKPLEALESHVAILILHRLIHQYVFDSIRQSVDYDRDGLL